MNVFIDKGYADPHTFCIRFLQSPEFKIETLKKFADYYPNKDSAAVDVARKIRGDELDKERLMLEYAKQHRQWFALKTNSVPEHMVCEDPEILLTEFGQEGWYGPIENDDDDSSFYFRIHSFNEYRIENEARVTEKIRWIVVAKVFNSYTSFHWNGFTRNSDDNIDSRSQFQFWNFIPEAAEELGDYLEVEYEDPNFQELILETIWDKYISNPEYTWNHLAVRAEASGVALNARSAGVRLIDVSGLLGLANRIASSVVDEIAGYRQNKLRLRVRRETLITRAENQIIKTLIKDWGTKSYEFRLLHGDDKLFRAHSYFGSKPHHNTQDRFPHFKSFIKFGGAYKAIEFLLNELVEE